MDRQVPFASKGSKIGNLLRVDRYKAMIVNGIRINITQCCLLPMIDCGLLL